MAKCWYCEKPLEDELYIEIALQAIPQKNQAGGELLPEVVPNPMRESAWYPICGDPVCLKAIFDAFVAKLNVDLT